MNFLFLLQWSFSVFQTTWSCLRFVQLSRVNYVIKWKQPIRSCSIWFCLIKIQQWFIAIKYSLQDKTHSLLIINFNFQSKQYLTAWKLLFSFFKLHFYFEELCKMEYSRNNRRYTPFSPMTSFLQVMGIFGGFALTPVSDVDEIFYNSARSRSFGSAARKKF